MNNDIRDINLSESADLKDDFKTISDNIKTELDKRINDYSQSLLFKYYSNFFYYLPKHCLTQIIDTSHNGYYITPNQQFFIKDKKNNRTLTYTPRIQTVILPVKLAYTERINDTFSTITLDFENNFNYDNFTIWLDDHFSKHEPYIANKIINEIVNSKITDIFAKVTLKDGNEVTKEIKITKLNYQFKPIVINIVKAHSPVLTYGFNVKLENLFNYASNEVKRIVLYFKLDIKKYTDKEIHDLFKINMLPLFNIYEDYSCNTQANMLFSEITLKHDSDKYAIPISTLAVYENNKPTIFNDYYFTGQNEYYFNVSTLALNYNVVMPNLNQKISNAKIHTYSQWVQDIDISKLIEINSNAVSSFNSKIIPIDIFPECTNYDQNSSAIYDVIDKLISDNIFSKTTFKSILSHLKFEQNKILLMAELIDQVRLDIFNNRLIIETSSKYLKKHKLFMEYTLQIICDFTNQNSFSFVREFIINEQNG